MLLQFCLLMYTSLIMINPGDCFFFKNSKGEYRYILMHNVDNVGGMEVYEFLLFDSNENQELTIEDLYKNSLYGRKIPSTVIENDIIGLRSVMINISHFESVRDNLHYIGNIKLNKNSYDLVSGAYVENLARLEITFGLIEKGIIPNVDRFSVELFKR